MILSKFEDILHYFNNYINNIKTIYNNKIMSELVPCLIIVYFYFKSNKISVGYETMAEFREFQKDCLLKFHESVLKQSCTEMITVLNILNDKLNNFPNTFLRATEQEDRCKLCWKDVIEFGYNRTPTPTECTSDWIITILNLVYYKQIDNKFDQNNGYVICDYNIVDHTNNLSYIIIKEAFPDNIHPN